MPLFFGVVDGHLLCVQAAEMVVPTFSDNNAVFDQNAADQRVGADLPSTPFSDEECMLHEHAICIAPIFCHTPLRSTSLMTACIAPRSQRTPK